MANEAALRDRLGDPIDFTVADGTGIEKGALLTLTDPRTASAGTHKTACAGVAAREKVADDGRTQLAVFRTGIFDMVASGAIIAGEGVQLAGYNQVIKIAAGTQTASGAFYMGSALETAADGETIQVHLNLQ